MLILVINPGSTSTKIAVYDDEKPILLLTTLLKNYLNLTTY